MLCAVLAVLAAAVGLLGILAQRRAAGAIAARARYEALAAHLPDVGVLLYDRELRCTLVEGGALPGRELRREHIEGRLLEDVLPPERSAELLAGCRAALAGEGSTQDWPGLRDDTRYELAHVPLRDARGAVTGGMVVARDVTRSARLQAELEAQRGFLAGVLEQLPGVTACDAAGRLRFVDPQLRERMDAATDPLDWPRCFGLRTPDGRAPLPAEDVPLFRALQGETVEGQALTVAGDGGSLRHVVAGARPVLDAHGEMIGAVGTAVDVTDSRDAQERLRASEERYRSVVESVGDVVFQTDMTGRWTFLNETWEGWTGIPVGQALGRSAFDIVHPADRERHGEAFARLAAGDVELVRIRHRYVTAADVTRRAEIRARLARDAAGRPLGVVGVIEDVTERHLTQQYEAAEQAVIQALEEAPDVESGVPALLAGLCRHLEWDLAELWTLDEEREVLVCTDAWGERREGLEALEAARVGESFEVGDGLQGQAWARRAPIWASGLQDDPLFRRGEAAEAVGVRSALALPVARGTEVLGTVLFFAREEREPDPGVGRLLQTIGAHLAQFLERRRAERELAELTRLVAELRGA